VRRLDGPSNNPTGAVSHFPPEALPLTPQAPLRANYVAPVSSPGALFPTYLRWRRRAPIGRWPTPALARPRLTM